MGEDDLCVKCDKPAVIETMDGLLLCIDHGAEVTHSQVARYNWGIAFGSATEAPRSMSDSKLITIEWAGDDDHRMVVVGFVAVAVTAFAFGLALGAWVW